jgi:MFS family permease
VSTSLPTLPSPPASTRETGPLLPWWREMTSYHWWVVTVAVLGWLFDGLDQKLFVLSRTPALRDLMPGISDAVLAQYASYATMIFILGWATGGLIFGFMGDRLGRTRTMVITILLYAMFTGLSAFSQTWAQFAGFRFLCGIGIGGEYAAGVALIAETVPSRARPYCLGLLQGLGAIGHFMGAGLTLYIGPQGTFGGFAGWRILFLIGIFPAFLVVLIRLRLRESEKWLQSRERANLEKGDELHRQLGDLTRIFRDARLRYCLIIGMLLGFAGQTGLWGIGYWTPELIRNALLEKEKTELVSQGRIAADEVKRLNINQVAQIAAAEPGKATALAQQWKKQSDSLVARGTFLQDLFGMFGIYAFTWFTAHVGRRKAFALSYLIGFGATVITFAFLKSPQQVFWMLPMLGFCAASVYGGFAIYFPELFPTRVRSTGVGFCYNVARYITALSLPLLGKLGSIYAGMGYTTPLRPAAITLSAVFFIGVITTFFAPETKDQPLPE